MEVQLLSAGLALAGAILAATIIGRFLAPRLESRKAATVASSEELHVFSQHLHLLAADCEMAEMYESQAMADVDANENIAKIFEMLQIMSKRSNKAAKIARAGKRARFTRRRRVWASRVVGLVIKFAGRQYGFIRKGQAYFQNVGEVEDNYFKDLGSLLEFASRVFEPGRFVWFPLRRLESRVKAFMLSLGPGLQQGQLAELHETGLQMQAGNGEGATG